MKIHPAPTKSAGGKKAKKSVPIPRSIDLASNIVYDTLKAQILNQIDIALRPKALDIEDYSIAFTIPRQISDQMPLKIDSDFSTMQ